MSSDTEPETDTPDPIDADFEPAVLVDPTSTTGPGGPGWLALGGMGIIAALLGGAIASGLDRTGGSASYAPNTLVSDVEVLSASKDALEAQLADLTNALQNAEAKLSREISATAAAAGDGEAIASLTADIASLNARLDSLSLGPDGDGLDLGVFQERLDALEMADQDDVTSPRLMNRAVTALRLRVEDLEAQIAEPGVPGEAAGADISDLVARLEALEVGDGGATEEAILALRSDLDLLTARVDTDVPSAEETARLQTWVDELREKEAQAASAQSDTRSATTSVLALLSIESAARQGLPFQTPLAELSRALPGNTVIADLEPLAASGAPTLPVLIRDFQSAKSAAAIAVQQVTEADDDAGDGWGWVRSIFGDAVEIRRTDAEPVETSDPIAAAEAALKAQNLRAAVAEIETLSGAGADAFANWKRGAEARLALESGLDTLRLTLLGAER